jgi:hypothetical protein
LSHPQLHEASLTGVMPEKGGRGAAATSLL